MTHGSLVTNSFAGQGLPEQMGRPKTTVPLNCMDKALFALHSQDEPMVLHWILAVEGAVDSFRLKSALLTVVSRHPRLNAIVRSGAFRQVQEPRGENTTDVLSTWDLAGPENAVDTTRARIDALHERRLSEWMNKPLDPRKAPPFRVLLLTEMHGHFTLVFTFHHAAVDGVRALRLIGEVIQEYNGVVEKSPPRMDRRPGTRAKDELVALAQACRLRTSHFYLRMIASLAHRFLLAPLSPNARICRTTSRPSPEIYFCQGSLNPHELGQIQSRSKSVGATVNDVLLAACFRTVEQWNDVHGKPSRKISIMVPVDIGSPTSSPVSANQVSFISVSTTRKERSDPDELLRKVRQRTSHMLKNGIAFSIVYAVYFCTRLPPRIAKAVARFLMATQIYLDSILLTNLGLIWPKGTALGKGTRWATPG